MSTNIFMNHKNCIQIDIYLWHWYVHNIYMSHCRFVASEMDVSAMHMGYVCFNASIAPKKGGEKVL